MAIHEVSLYELLKEQFSGEVDARTTEIELGKFPRIEQLLRRAQKTLQFDRV